LSPIKKIIEDIEKQDAEFRAAVSIAVASEKCHTDSIIQGERFFPAWLFDQDSDFVTKIWKGLQEIGLDARVTQYSFCTNGSHYAGEAGIKTIGFGPSRENLAHVIDEYVEIEQLELASKGYEKIMEIFLSD
jgi:acetylornithine deacetylase/succinyl-diaminopimelate desuccinylase-like protein